MWSSIWRRVPLCGQPAENLRRFLGPRHGVVRPDQTLHIHVLHPGGDHTRGQIVLVVDFGNHDAITVVDRQPDNSSGSSRALCTGHRRDTVPRSAAEIAPSPGRCIRRGSPRNCVCPAWHHRSSACFPTHESAKSRYRLPSIGRFDDLERTDLQAI